jgi:hypothetical protein
MPHHPRRQPSSYSSPWEHVFLHRVLFSGCMKIQLLKHRPEALNETSVRIWGFHGDKYQGGCLLGSGDVYTARVYQSFGCPYCFHHQGTVMMEAVQTSDTLVNSYHFTVPYNAEESRLLKYQRLSQPQTNDWKRRGNVFEYRVWQLVELCKFFNSLVLSFDTHYLKLVHDKLISYS